MKKGERELIIEAKNGNKDAVQKLYEICEGYIKILALSYKKNNSYLTVDDFMQDGFIGVVNAAKEYDLNYDVNFLTYASYHIKKEMITDISMSGKVCRIPAHIYAERKDTWIKYGKALTMYEDSDKENIAKFMNVEKEELEEIKKTYYRCGFSLNEKTGEGEIIDYIIDNTKNTEDEVERKLLNERIRQIIDSLENEKYKMVIKLRFGLDGDAKTLKEIGEILGVSGERARQIKSNALRILKWDEFGKELAECVHTLNEPDNFHQSEKDLYATIWKNNKGKRLIYKK